MVFTVSFPVKVQLGHQNCPEHQQSAYLESSWPEMRLINIVSIKQRKKNTHLYQCSKCKQTVVLAISCDARHYFSPE